ncbi:MAG: hypothetical protein UY23_C0004G0017 [Candidatus Jorgensenbacteria bacterium GW2011_GWA1_48_11]|uniref:Uncharacterized protein n=1 Tax=Candidatus Jorgensenbacteria bacterium GW2011_GWA1_48_11 TaxID=1618660 RepID=A0A0G1UAB8_9BACT|nr:MAG: hypothetical protein UY23_C0004G0017 [Candidatus Jorgensenbacteria bacterium GW2011_GWA1_48_11]KKW11802.1 MAG: hypothetical protein UY51_C0005G0043 [Candidatus Jorgensenbacteria bacterium GW2011_GWB1_49_9]
MEFLAPELPNPEDPEIGKWLAELDKTQPDNDTILVGHSRGGVAILRWLEKLPEGKRVKKVILVGTNSGKSGKMDRTENNMGFYSNEGYDFKRIKSHCDDFVIFHSKDDQWVPFEAGEENAKGLGAKFFKFEDKGHFGKGVGDIPELMKEIEI